MGVIKATTIQQRFGFQDNDLKVPAHDEIMLWMDANADQVLAPAYNPEWPEVTTLNQLENGGAFWNERAISPGEHILIPAKPIKPNDTVVKSKVWEKPISSGNFIIGFVDMQVVIEYPSELILWLQEDGLYRWGGRRSSHKINIEVKTAIPSLGELIRQIQMYKEYDKHSKYIVVCPDDRYKTMLAKQGIGFIKYEV